MCCDIIIPVWDQPEETKRCIDSVAANTVYPHRLVIIDNGSSRRTEWYLKDLASGLGAQAILIRNECNLGFVRAVNQGISASNSPYLCLLNNDTVVTKGWLEEMLSVMKSDPAIGAVNPSSNTSGQFPGKDESIDGYSAKLALERGKVQELYAARGFCMLMKREMVEALGAFDEAYSIGYFEETDYSYKAQRAGYRIARAKAAYVFHEEHTTFKRLAASGGLFEKNERIFFSRWGRPVRAVYLLDKRPSSDKVDRISIDTARQGHQMLIFLRKGLSWPVTLDHFDIRRFDINRNFFGIASLYKILKRRKKKMAEVLITENKLFGVFLKALGCFHGAEVMISPEKEMVSAILAARSKKL